MAYGQEIAIVLGGYFLQESWGIDLSEHAIFNDLLLGKAKSIGRRKKTADFQFLWDFYAVCANIPTIALVVAFQ